MKDNIDKNIKEELISKDLNKILKPLLIFIILVVLFGYAGYVYSIDNNQDIRHGIIFGSLFPLGIALIKRIDFGGAFTYIAYTIAYICLVDYIPTYIGIIIIMILILLFIACFIYIEKKDRTKEIAEIRKSKNLIRPQKISTYNINTTNNNYNNYNEIAIDSIDEDEDKENNFFDENEDLEYECEVCFKKISFEEYELYDCMCEDCYQDVHTDEQGNFHEDKYFK